MNILPIKPKPLAALSALLFAVVQIFLWSYLAWVCLLPLFLALYHSRGKQAFTTGAFFGLLFGGGGFYWLVNVVTHFTGGSILYGILVYLIAVLFIALWFGLLLLGFSWLKMPAGSWLNAFLMAALWTAGEWLLSVLLPGMPWLGFHAGNILLGNLYAIQPASLGGIYLLSFLVVFINYLAAHFCTRRQWKGLIAPLALLILYMAGGYTSHRLFQRQDKADKGHPVTMALLCENTSPDIKWNKESGNYLVKRLLDLNTKAAALKPDLALWTESAVPWTYNPGDDFVKKVISITGPAGITHIMGINTDYQDNVVYNSAYCLMPDGKVAGRYDKRYLLDLVEKPLAFLSLPFLQTDGFYAQEGDSEDPLPTPYGKVGVLICNEAIVPGAATGLVRNGADFLANISNDGWFSHVPYLVDLHFFNARLRAVEERRDMAVNSNMGISGKIDASGDVEVARTGREGFVQTVQLFPHHNRTFYNRFPFLALYAIGFIIFLFPVTRSFITKQ